MPRKAAQVSEADKHAAAGGAIAVDRALFVLSVFRLGDTALGLAELAQRSGLYKSTLLRLLASLEHAGLVRRQSDGRYGLGPEVARLNAVYAASFSLEAVVMPALRELVRITRESAAFMSSRASTGCACTASIHRSRCATMSAPATAAARPGRRRARAACLCRRVRHAL